MAAASEIDTLKWLNSIDPNITTTRALLSLEALCRSSLAENPENIRCPQYLPSSLSQKIWEQASSKEKEDESSLISALPLRNLDFSYEDCSVSTLLVIRYLTLNRDQLESVNLSNVPGPVLTSPEVYVAIGNCPKLKALQLCGEIDLDVVMEMTNTGLPQRLPLERFTLHKFPNEIPNEFFYLLIYFNETLTHLDLSSCSLSCFDVLRFLPKLHTLILYNVDLKPWDGTSGFFAVVPRMSKDLRILDISQHQEELGTFHNPTNLLRCIISSFPELERLDISGTNLAGPEDHTVPLSGRICDIPALISRVDRPLSYLGLYNTKDNASYRNHIPAQHISGNRDELQLFTAVNFFLNRVNLLQEVLGTLFCLIKGGRMTSLNNCVNVTLDSMKRHPAQVGIQAVGSACLWEILKNAGPEIVGPYLTAAQINGITSVIADGLKRHHTKDIVVRFGGWALKRMNLTACRFPAKEKIAEAMLFILEHSRVGSLKEDTSSFILNELVSRMQPHEKVLLNANMRLVLRLLRWMQGRLNVIPLEIGISEENLIVVTTVMWNVANGCPEACESFMEHGFLEAYTSIIPICCTLINNDVRDEMIRHLTGIICNIAQAESLARDLLLFRSNDGNGPSIIRILYELLCTDIDEWEIAYMCGFTLTRLLLNPTLEASWRNLESPSRNQVQQRLTAVIPTWVIRCMRKSYLNSLEPFLQMLEPHVSPECALFAAFSLCNLSTTYPDTYIPLLLSEGGNQTLLSDVSSLRRQEVVLVDYLNRTIQNIQNFSN